MNQINLNHYQQKIADLYTARSDTYDNSLWHQKIAERLVESGKVKPSQHILDIATGTGHSAIAVAKLVGETGKVIGVDISPGMLLKARNKAQLLNLNNLEFQLVDGETLDFPANSFDRIFCASAFIWMSDLVKSLRLWRKLLKPGGIIGVQAFAETAFIGGVIMQKIVAKYGVDFLMSKPTGTLEKCQDLFAEAGLNSIEIKVEQTGSYISLEQAKKMYADRNYPAPGQDPHPLAKLSTVDLKQIRHEFEYELEALETERGIWNDITTFYIYGCK
jgi:ubiquinone/menaquinone biosynthesis C-methylase UbiE